MADLTSLFTSRGLLRLAAVLAGSSIAGGLSDAPVSSPKMPAIATRIAANKFPSMDGLEFPTRADIGFRTMVLNDRDPEARGFQYGLESRERIQKCAAFYLDIIGLSSSTLEAKVLPYMESTEQHLPLLHAELAGIARSAGVPLWQVYLINCRTELLSGASERSECTSVYLPRERVFAQTWDWAEEFRDLMVTLDTTTSSGCRIRTFAEPGMLGKIGCNSNGLSIGLNFIAGKDAISGEGIPLHLVLRHLLEADSVGNAIQRFLSLPVSSHGNIFIGSDSGEGAWIEISGNKYSVRRWQNEKALHTNHYMLLGSSGIEDGESASRLSLALRAVEKQEPESDMHRVTRALEQPGVTLPFREDPVLGEYGTVARIIVDLSEGEMQVIRL